MVRVKVRRELLTGSYYPATVSGTSTYLLVDLPYGCLILYRVSLLLREDCKAELRFRSFRLSSILSVRRKTHDRGNGHRPNMVRMGKGWPLRSS